MANGVSSVLIDDSSSAAEIATISGNTDLHSQLWASIITQQRLALEKSKDNY